MPRWYVYHKKWYIYHFEVIWLRVGILLKSQIPGNIKHWSAFPKPALRCVAPPHCSACPHNFRVDLTCARA